MSTCNIDELLDSGNQFQMLGGGLSQVARLALLKHILLAANPSADTSVNTLLEAGKCFTCLTPGQQRIVKLQLLCEISGGTTPVDCGTPTETVTISGAGDPDANGEYTLTGPQWVGANYTIELNGAFWVLYDIGHVPRYRILESQFPCGEWQVLSDGYGPAPTGEYSSSVPMPTDMVLWLNENGLASYGGDEEIPTWFDSSGNGNNAFSSGDALPTVAVLSPSNLKVAFLGNDFEPRYFDTNTTFFSGNGPRTVFGVWQKVDISFPGAVCGGGSQSNNELSSLYARNDVNAGLCSPYHASFATDFSGPLQSVNNITYADAYRHNGTTISLWRNGSNVTSQAQVLATASESFCIGATSGGGSDLYLFGYIAEVIVWDRALTDSEMAAVFDYLSPKWGT